MSQTKQTKQTSVAKTQDPVGLRERRRSPRSFSEDGISIEESDSDSAWAAFNEAAVTPANTEPKNTSRARSDAANRSAGSQDIGNDFAIMDDRGLEPNDVGNNETVKLESVPKVTQINLALQELGRQHREIADTIEGTWGHRECLIYIKRLLVEGYDKTDTSRTGFTMEVVGALTSLVSLHPQEK